MALISDAGTPLVSDPGYKLVRDCLNEGHRVTSLPGPSALLAAIGSTGLATDTFLFAGFLPAKQGARRARLAELQVVPATLVFFEAPSRLAESLADMASVLGEREAAVARELTKLHEEVQRGTPAALATWAAEASPKGEMVILVGPPLEQVVSDEAIAAKLEPLLDRMSLSDAVKAVADMLGVAKGRAYDVGLALKKSRRQLAHTGNEDGRMAHVTLIGNLRQLTGGVTELDVDAASVRQLFARLGEKYPALAPHLEQGLAVAIDGQIYQDALLQEIGADSEVHILPQIAGG